MKYKTIQLMSLCCFVIIITYPKAIFAGDNQNASCSLDMNIDSISYDNTVCTKDIEPTISAYANETITVAIVAHNVINLDTYQAEILFDNDHLKFIKAYENVPAMGITNILKANGGTTIGFQASLKKAGIINIANSLVGKNKDQAPEGSGICAILRFKVLKDSKSELILKHVYFVDSDQQKDHIVQTNNAQINQ